MSNFMCSNLVTEGGNRQNLSYILNENDYFFETVFKILRKKESTSFVKCEKLLLNGKIKTIYNIEQLKNLEDVIASLSEEQYMMVVNNIINEIEEIKTNGFIQLETIDIDLDKIFIDLETLRVKFICVPINIGSTVNTIALFQQTLQNVIAQFLFNSGYIANPSFAILYNQCVCGELLNKGQSFASNFYLQAVDEPAINNIIIRKNNFILGKSPDSDGLINTSTAVSRKHCMISFEGSNIYLTDLGSLNGTFINNIKIESNKQYQIRVKDTIMMSDVKFIVCEM